MGIGDFRPYPKSQQLKGHQKEKDTPKHKEKRPKKKKNPYLYRGRIVPTQKERTRIIEENYNRMIEVFGNYCQECGFTPISAHHLIFRSAMGTGNWRNLAPLCKRCHDRAHSDYEFTEYLRDKRAKQYGPYFGQDKYSLFMEGLLPNTTDEAYERFMRGEEERAQKSVYQGMDGENSGR
jgi:5-methylcytosine-specific restriction endonuclease McrA